MSLPSPSKDWPYPYWIAHRGAGTLAPENTLAAFRLGAQFGYRMFECDAKLSADDQLFLLHDSTLERTTNGQGAAADLRWDALSRLDAGGWHSGTYAGEPPPSLDAVARFCLRNGYALNIEIKPTPGSEARTGAQVARAAAHLWQSQAQQPLLTSFQPEALAAARSAHRQATLGLLLDQLPTHWLDTARQLACAAVVCQHSLWNADTVAAARGAGLRLLAYTVNDLATVQRLQALGLDGLITDRVDVFSPHAG